MGDGKGCGCRVEFEMRRVHSRTTDRSRQIQSIDGNVPVNFSPWTWEGFGFPTTVTDAINFSDMKYNKRSRLCDWAVIRGPRS